MKDCLILWEQLGASAELVIFLLGVVVASSAYLLQNFTLNPYLRYKNTVGNVRAKLRMHANVFGNDVMEPKAQAALDDFRELSCELERNYYGIGACWLLAPVLPHKKDISEASQLLTRLSNSAFDKGINAVTRCHQDAVDIKILLKIEKLNKKGA